MTLKRNASWNYFSKNRSQGRNVKFIIDVANETEFVIKDLDKGNSFIFKWIIFEFHISTFENWSTSNGKLTQFHFNLKSLTTTCISHGLREKRFYWVKNGIKYLVPITVKLKQLVQDVAQRLRRRLENICWFGRFLRTARKGNGSRVQLHLPSCWASHLHM